MGSSNYSRRTLYLLGDRKMKETKVSFLEISCNDEIKGIEAIGRLFMNNDGKLEFEGNVGESARVFFEEYLKPMCEKYIKELTNRKT